jgi:hypothetical protein
MSSFTYLYLYQLNNNKKQTIMTNGEKQLVEYLNVELNKAERILSKLGKKRATTLTKEDGDQWITISFRKRWLLSQIDSIIQK